MRFGPKAQSCLSVGFKPETFSFGLDTIPLCQSLIYGSRQFSIKFSVIISSALLNHMDTYDRILNLHEIFVCSKVVGVENLNNLTIIL